MSDVKFRIDENLRKEICDYYKSRPMSMLELRDKFHFCLPTLSKILKDGNCDIYSKLMIFNPNLNEHYFDVIDSDKKAYYLGLILTDGCVFVDKTKEHKFVSITLKTSDAYILDEFKKDIGTSSKLMHDPDGCSCIAIHSNILCDKLISYGIVPRKSYNSYLPSIPDKYMSGLLRGILDGDGSIISRIWKRKHAHRICYCGTERLMKEIAEYIGNTLGIKIPNIYVYKNRYQQNFAEIKWSSINDVLLVGSYLYKNSSIHLHRKRAIFEDFLKHYNLVEGDNTVVTQAG